ncbi:YaiO family outer membrane beta-barrel protein [Flavobacterium soyangense]|uniref:YaiO family outer membrane beta-barrel protein n=1 Tax=Flavobacterium soyangense TaxID=2023265 RepID=A0A930UD51_9FLAO|nr:YaiO family outer membrane beta-barrel protein [Flavobacterium soyangense]MBF2709880.1 YaiO family outer membrane beta-barrel protein [Flavobacterium soyangense]
MKKLILIISFNFILGTTIFAQKIDTDSLLVKTYYELNTSKNYPKAIQLAQLGIKISPNYLDFYVALGRSYMITKKIDSSRISFNHVIDKNPKYKEAFTYLAKLEIEEKNAPNAITVIDKGLTYYPEEKDFYFLKLQAINIENDEDKSYSFLTFLTKKYPLDTDLQQQLIDLKLKSISDRFGINYNYTAINRSGIGPWHLIGLQYVRERKKVTLIGRINYADRRASGSSINSGVQYELETYFKNNKKSYSYTDIAYSNDIVFPEIRLAYSYFHNFNKGWEADIGMRYSQTINKDLYSSVIGIGKYLGPYWLNLRTYIQSDSDKIHPAITFTTRYYLNTRYDYASFTTGYGTSPDERIMQEQLQQRVSLNSYRIGAGYNKLLYQHFITGFQASLNHQEYIPNKFQNEFNLFFSIQYKF